MSELKRRTWYSLQYKLEAVRLVKGGQAAAVTQSDALGNRHCAPAVFLDARPDRSDELGQLMQSMQRMTLSLRQLILRLSAGITQLASSTEEMAVISQQTSSGVAQQKLETMQVATAMNEMTATVQDVARSAEEASTAATHSAEQAEFSNRILDRTMSGIKNLAQGLLAQGCSVRILVYGQTADAVFDDNGIVVQQIKNVKLKIQNSSAFEFCIHHFELIKFLSF